MTNNPDLCVCSCVSFSVPQIAQDSNPLLNLSFEVSASFHGKAGKLEMGGRVGGSRSGVYPGNWLYWILAMCTSPCCLPTPSPLFMGGPFWCFCVLLQVVLELPAGFNRKKRWLACFSLSVQRQDANVCSLCAGSFFIYWMLHIWGSERWYKKITF